MKRVTILGVLVAIGSVSIAVKAAQQPAQPQPSVDNITVEKVKDNLFVLRGGGGNTAVFVTAQGVTLVDTKNPGWGQPLLDKVKTITDKPVTMVINTHTHYDHNSGNVEMPASVEIVAHATTAKLMTQMNPVTGLGTTPNVFKDNPGKGIPKRTFTDKLTLGSGADRIDLYYFGPSHTGGDAFVEPSTRDLLNEQAITVWLDAASAGSSSATDGGTTRNGFTSAAKDRRSSADGRCPSKSRCHTSSRGSLSASSTASYWR